MAEDPEKRFQRAMESLFSRKAYSSPPVTSSSPTGSARRGRIGGIAGYQEQASGSTQISKITARSPGRALTTSVDGNGLRQPQCRPWDRGDLFRRLATFKSTLWFGKPHAIGPMACARRGWINVELDLLACEGCGSRLGMTLPPSLGSEICTVVESFVEQLDSKHKPLCAWKGNVCSEDLGLFPPTPVAALVDGFKERCESLPQFSALPVISSRAFDALKLWGGARIECIFAYPTPLVRQITEAGEEPDNEFRYNGYYYAQRLIALCGWEPRLLPYTVNWEECSTEFPKSKDSSLHVSLITKEGSGQEESLKGYNRETKRDPASAVLDCKLCGASVGLWSFSTIRQPSAMSLFVRAERLESDPNPNATVATEICKDADAETTTSRLLVSTPRVLNLSLTIAGGPPPTQLSSPAKLTPSVFPFPGFHTSISQSDGTEGGTSMAPNEVYFAPLPDHGATMGDKSLPTICLPVASDLARGTVGDLALEDSGVGEGSGSRKRSPETIRNPVDGLSQDDELDQNLNIEDRGVDSSLPKRRKLGETVSHAEETLSETVSQDTETSFKSVSQVVETLPKPSSQAAKPLSELVRVDSQSLACTAMDTDQLQNQEVLIEPVEKSPSEVVNVNLDEHNVVDHVGGNEPESSEVLNERGSEAAVINTEESKCVAEDSLKIVIVEADLGGDRRGISEKFPGGEELSVLSKAKDDGYIPHNLVMKNLTSDDGQNLGAFAVSVQTTGFTSETVHCGGILKPEVGTNPLLDDLKNPASSVELVQAPVLLNQSAKMTEDTSGLDRNCGDGNAVALIPCSDPCLGPISVIEREAPESRGQMRNSGGSVLTGENEAGHTIFVDKGEGSQVVMDSGIEAGNIDVHTPKKESTAFPTWDMREFDPIHQHRHFCPWVNMHVTAKDNANSSAVCGWQLTLDALNSYIQRR